jgi:hypothetical protein
MRLERSVVGLRLLGCTLGQVRYVWRLTGAAGPTIEHDIQHIISTCYFSCLGWAHQHACGLYETIIRLKSSACLQVGCRQGACEGSGGAIVAAGQLHLLVR